MRVLVAIASYETANDRYLERVVREYQSTGYDLDIVVLSNITKAVPSGSELIVGLPTKDPWSLPFAHKRVFAERADYYDLFIYSEDDILITDENIRAFLHMSTILPENELAGFVRVEEGPDGRTYYPDVNKHFHWDPESVRVRGKYALAFFTNEHAACYMLTQSQLRRAIGSGGFMVRPHQGKYDLACTAATDPYTQCGFRKMICISDLHCFQVRHLSNKYIGTDYDLEKSDFDRQVEALLEIKAGKRTPWQLLGPGTVTRLTWSKSYYEPPRPEILDMIPAGAKSVLSIGCGWGASESHLTQRGIRVVGVPLDTVISTCAEARGVTIVCTDFDMTREGFGGERFDCILISNILHLLRDPLRVFRACTELLSPRGFIVLAVPNFNYLKTRWRRVRRMPGYRDLRDHDEAGVHRTNHRVVRQWLKACDLTLDRVVNVVPERALMPLRLSLGMVAPGVAKELIVRSQKRGTKEADPAQVSQHSHSRQCDSPVISQ